MIDGFVSVLNIWMFRLSL